MPAIISSDDLSSTDIHEVGNNRSRTVSDEFERLDRLLRQLGQILEGPGDGDGATPEMSWQKLDLMYNSMGPDALAVLLRRQGMDRATSQEALAVLESRRQALE
jgi:hypothetical protein